MEGAETKSAQREELEVAAGGVVSEYPFRREARRASDRRVQQDDVPTTIPEHLEGRFVAKGIVVGIALSAALWCAILLLIF